MYIFNNLLSIILIFNYIVLLVYYLLSTLFLLYWFHILLINFFFWLLCYLSQNILLLYIKLFVKENSFNRIFFIKHRWIRCSSLLIFIDAIYFLHICCFLWNFFTVVNWIFRFIWYIFIFSWKCLMWFLSILRSFIFFYNFWALWNILLIFDYLCF